MDKMIFINLPVIDLEQSKAFYEAIGAANVPAFTNDSAAMMKFSDTISVMLLTHSFWRTFTDKEIVDAHRASEVALALSCENRGEVDRLVEGGAASGGTADVNPPQDHGFMYSRTIADPDGHVWEPMWMDVEAAMAAPADVEA